MNGFKNIDKPKNTPNLFITLFLYLVFSLAGRLMSLRFDILNIEAVRVGFGDLPVLLSSIWLGPFWGVFIGGASDLLGFLLQPIDTFLPQITLIAMLRGFLPGFLVRCTGESVRIRNFALQIGITQGISSILLMPLVLYQAFQIPMVENMITRVIVQVFMVPFYGMIYILIKDWQSREELLEERSLLEQILGITQTGVNITDAHYNLQYVDSRWQQVYGDPSGEKCFQYFMDLEKPCQSCGVVVALERKEVIVTEAVLPKENNRIVEVHTIPFQDKRGQWLVAEFNVDITARKRIEDALRESQEKLKTLFSSMREMVVIHQLIFHEKGRPVNYRITDCNAAFTSITGIPREEAVGELATVVYKTSSAPYLEEFSQAVLSGEPYNFETYYAPLKSHFSISVIPMGKDRFSTVTTDISAVKEYQQILSAKNKELEQLVYVASHDLRSPLVNIVGYSREIGYLVEDLEQILDASPTSSKDLSPLFFQALPELKDALDHIQNSSRQMDALIKGLLELSRSGRRALNIVALDMNELMAQVASVAEFRIREANVALCLHPLPSCLGDAVQVTQVFTNLLDNALKFLHPHRPGEITISGCMENGRSVYCVADNGEGVALEHQETIFQLFHQVDRGEKDGEGLGLSITRQVLFRLEGKIWVASEPGKGSRFYVSLPSVEGNGTK